MSDASSIRNAVSLPSATLKNEGSIRFHRTTRRTVVSNGNEWVPQRAPKMHQANYAVTANADLGTKSFFVANKACRITSIQEVHATAGTAAGAVTLQVTKESGTTTAGNGTALLTATFDLKGTANTVQTGALNTNYDVVFLNPGDRLSVVFTGTLTSLAGVAVTVELEHATTEFDATVFQNVNANVASECFFVASEPYEIIAVSEVHATAGTDASAVTLQVTKDTATNAPGAGTALLTNNANAGFDVRATANTVQSGALLTTTPAALVLAKGDRLSLAYTGTLTAAAGVVVGVTLRPLNRTRATVTSRKKLNADCVDNCFFIANRPCQVISISEVHSTAGTDASAVNLQVAKDTGTNAPGAGTFLLTNNTNAGFDAKATANTVQVGTLTATDAALVLAKGDRLSLDVDGVTTALAGTVVTVVLDYITI